MALGRGRRERDKGEYGIQGRCKHPGLLQDSVALPGKVGGCSNHLHKGIRGQEPDRGLGAMGGWKKATTPAKDWTSQRLRFSNVTSQTLQ